MDEKTLFEIWQKTLGRTTPLETLSADATYRPAPETSPVASQADAASLFLPTHGLSREAPSAGAKGRAGAAGQALPASTSSFAIRDELGRGGMGVVYLAHQASLRRDVALKQILPEASDDATRDRFVAEALVTGSLDHPNIVPVHELGRTPGGDVFLAMKKVSGISWKDLLHPESEEARQKAAQYDRAAHIDILVDVCHAVAFAHTKGVVHRDLKPENVMVGDFGEILLMDWGIAVDITDRPVEHRRAPHRSTVISPSGTPAYMPPELAEGDGAAISPQTDVYLLGAILHEIVTGRPPHQGPNLLSVLVSASRSEPKTYGPDVPHALSEICNKAMARDPSDRHASVRDFQADLHNYLRFRESMAISETADAELAQLSKTPSRHADSDRNRLYAKYAKVVARYEQALELWEGNEDARQGARAARLAYAEVALDLGDLGLSEAQVTPLGETGEALALLEKIELARTARDRAARNARRMRSGIAGLLAVIVIGLTVGMVLINRERRIARTAQKTAETERDRADVERDKAEAARALADQRRREAEIEAAYAKLGEARAQINAGNTRVGLESLSLLGAEFQRLDLPRHTLDLIEARAHELGGFVLAHGDTVARCLALSPDGRSFLVGGMGEISWWDAGTSMLIKRIDMDGEKVNAIAWAPDGKRFVTGTDKFHVRLHDLATGEILREYEVPHLYHGPGPKLGRQVTSVAFLPDGSAYLAGCEDQSMRVFDASSGEKTHEITPFQSSDRKLKPQVLCLDVSPDGKHMLLGLSSGDIQIRQTGSYTLKAAINTGARVETARFTPDGLGILAGGRTPNYGQDQASLRWKASKTLHLWDILSGQLIREFDVDANTIALAISPDGKRALSSHWFERARLWDLLSGRELRRFANMRRECHDLAFLGDGRAFLAAIEGVSLWDLESEKVRGPIPCHRGGVFSLCVSPCGRMFLTGCDSGKVCLWDRATGMLLKEFDGLNREVDAVAFGPGGALVAAGDRNGALRVWKLASGEQVLKSDESDFAVKRILFVPGTPFLVAANSVPEMFVCHLETGAATVVQNELPGNLTGFTRLPNGRIALSDDKGTCQLWELDGQAGIMTRITDDGGGGFSALSPDGKTAVAVENDKTLRVFETVSGKTLFELRGHADKIKAVCFSPDASILASGGHDNTILLWDMSSGLQITALKGHRFWVNNLAFTPDGRFLISGGQDHQIFRWDLGYYREVERRKNAFATISVKADPMALTGDQMLAAGRLHVARHQWASAWAYFRGAANAGRPAEGLLAAQLAWLTGDLQGAKKDFQALAKAETAEGATRNWLALCAAPRGDFDFFYNLGHRESEYKAFERALACFDHAVRLRPRDPDPWFYRGSMFQVATDRKDLNAALHDFLQAHRRDPKKFGPLMNLGVIYCYHVKNYARSIMYLERLLAAHPDNRQAGVVSREIARMKRELGK